LHQKECLDLLAVIATAVLVMRQQDAVKRAEFQPSN